MTYEELAEQFECIAARYEALAEIQSDRVRITTANVMAISFASAAEMLRRAIAANAPGAFCDD